MKAAIILLLILSALIIGCAQEAPETTTQKTTQPSEAISDQEAINEVDGSLLSEDEEIEIGEMI